MPSKPSVALAMRGGDLRDDLFSTGLRRRLEELAECDFDLVISRFANVSTEVLAGVDVLLTGWGSPRIDGPALARMPRLQLIAHAAGSVKGHVDRTCWDSGIAVTTAAAANAIPVAEFTLAQILLAGKDTLHASRLYRERRGRVPGNELQGVGNYERTVGIISASTIGRLVVQRLRTFDFQLVLFDPTLDSAEASRLGARLVGLDELMSISDVVSLHAPVLPQTVGMIGAAQLARMRDGATFVNTARGKLVDHAALRAELVRGRISAVLDVTDPEPLGPDDPLFDLPNVQLTPHIAGSMGTELHRMTAFALDEIENFAHHRPLRHPVRITDLDAMA